jgi:hypothetical protein
MGERWRELNIDKSNHESSHVGTMLGLLIVGEKQFMEGYLELETSNTLQAHSSVIVGQVNSMGFSKDGSLKFGDSNKVRRTFPVWGGYQCMRSSKSCLHYGICISNSSEFSTYINSSSLHSSSSIFRKLQ